MQDASQTPASTKGAQKLLYGLVLVSSATQPFSVSSRNPPTHKRPLRTEPHSFPIQPTRIQSGSIFWKVFAPRSLIQSQPCLWGGALRDDTKNRCVADYVVLMGTCLFLCHIGQGCRYSRNSTNLIDEGVLRIRARDEKEGLPSPNPDGSFSLAVRGT